MVEDLIPAQDSDFKVVLPPLPVVNATCVVSSPSLGPITHFHHACMSVLFLHLFCSGHGHSLVTDARTQTIHRYCLSINLFVTRFLVPAPHIPTRTFPGNETLLIDYLFVV